MRWAWGLVLVGCRFSSALPGETEGDAAVAIDAGQDTSTSIDASVAPFCDPTDPTLVACYEFEGSTTDGSMNQMSASNQNLTFVPGKVGMAMEFGATSAADIPDSAKFDSAAVTVEAWIKPSQIPGVGLRAGIADMNGQWGLFVHETGRLQCNMVNGISAQIDANISTTAWTHAACTYANGTTKIYVNGVKRFEMAGGGALATGGNTGVSLGADNPPGSGSRLIGLIDQVRLFSRARTDAEICADAACME